MNGFLSRFPNLALETRLIPLRISNPLFQNSLDKTSLS